MSGKVVFTSGEAPREPYSEGTGAWYDAPHIGIPFSKHAANRLWIAIALRIFFAVILLFVAWWVFLYSRTALFGYEVWFIGFVAIMFGVLCLVGAFTTPFENAKPYIWKYAIEITNRDLILRNLTSTLSFLRLGLDKGGHIRLQDIDSLDPLPSKGKGAPTVYAVMMTQEMVGGKLVHPEWPIDWGWESIPIQEITKLLTYRIAKAKGENPPPPEFS